MPIILPIEAKCNKTICYNLCVDHLTPSKRSWNMSRIKSKNTSPEVIFRKILFSLGGRYRLNYSLPGKPDIVLPGRKIAVFINGCFWHQHKKCKRSSVPKSNRIYWIPKLERDITRQTEVIKLLNKMNWKTILIWECQVLQFSKIKGIINSQILHDKQSEKTKNV